MTGFVCLLICKMASPLCMLGNFSCFCCRLLTFFKIILFEKFFQEHYQSDERFGSRSGPDLGPNCFQRLSADDKCSHWQGKSKDAKQIAGIAADNILR